MLTLPSLAYRAAKEKIMQPDFSQRVVMITGAAGNLGVAVTHAFWQAGAQLVLVDRTPARLPKLYPELAASTTHLFAPPTDVTDASSVAAMMTEIEQRHGRIDVLVNTAGGYRAGTPLHATPLAEADFMFGLNARSVFVMCQAVIPLMLRQGYGKIINTASRAALSGAANQAAYSASKSAIVRLTESMAEELKDIGINVNCVLPGLIDTPPNRAAMPNADFSRWVAPAAIADVILFLASEQARAINGAAIPVYGRS
jgi:NAD(P)-dependent dehydrogenase (short-subunit alcohol dehydrogenase family)